MANELVPVSLEQAQARATVADTQRQVAMDNVILYVTKIESEIHASIKTMEEIIPQLQKSVNDLNSAVCKATDEDSKVAQAKLAKKHQRVADFMIKNGIKGVEVLANSCDTKEGKHQFEVCFKQNTGRYSSDEVWLGTNEKHDRISLPISKNLADLQAQHKVMIERLSDAQKQLLVLKCKAQDISRHEREGKALVIKNERELTEEGRKLVQKIEQAAEDKCSDVTRYVDELKKSTKLLTSSKK